jgi:hypothetical protein
MNRIQQRSLQLALMLVVVGAVVPDNLTQQKGTRPLSSSTHTAQNTNVMPDFGQILNTQQIDALTASLLQ